MIIDPLYLILLAPGLALALWAHRKVRSAYAKAQRSPASVSGADAARRMLDQVGLYDVGIEMTRGFLSDHYDPRRKLLRLCPE
jgi:Zn-dependent membrane protease YugP